MATQKTAKNAPEDAMQEEHETDVPLAELEVEPWPCLTGNAPAAETSGSKGRRKVREAPFVLSLEGLPRTDAVTGKPPKD